MDIDDFALAKCSFHGSLSTFTNILDAAFYVVGLIGALFHSHKNSSSLCTSSIISVLPRNQMNKPTVGKLLPAWSAVNTENEEQKPGNHVQYFLKGVLSVGMAV